VESYELVCVNYSGVVIIALFEFIYRLDGIMVGLQDIHWESVAYVLKIRHHAI